MSNLTKDQILSLKEAIKQGKYPSDFEVPGWSEEYPLLDHQKGCVLWSILTPKGLIANSTGTGKTSSALGLLQWLKSKGRLGPSNRALIIVPAISVYGSWKKDGFEKFLPDMLYAIGRGSKQQRYKVYSDPSWEVLLTNYETVRNDVEVLEKMSFPYVILDEADAVRNHETKTAKAVKRVTKRSSRALAMTATPIQNHLVDLHGIMEAVGLSGVFGTEAQFRKSYQKTELKRVFYNGKWNWKKVTVGYKNTEDLKKKMAPYYIRMTYRDINVKMPELLSQTKRLEMTPEQRRLYQEVQSGFVKLTPDSPVLEIRSAVLRLRQVCTTTANLTEESNSSGKFDWLIKQLTSDWQDEKIVLFSNWKTSIVALQERLVAAGIKHIVITGDESSQEKREELRQAFWNDPEIKLLIGTTSIEKSLNLQCAKIQVNLDMLWNPARHDQLAGRVHRIGSIHDDVYVFSLVMEDSIEEGLMKLLQSKQAISDHIFDEESALFEKLSREELIHLIRS